MGPLAQKVIRIAPPLTITEAEARDSVDALNACFASVATESSPAGRFAPQVKGAGQ
jgi:acetylornithine/succinyldiaminopimelate/putrescine aminotransferase